MAKYIMGIDVGTTGSKAMVMDSQGNIIGSGYREYKLNEPKPNWVEVGAKFLLEITFEAVKDAVKDSKLDPMAIEGISFSVNRSSFCLMDADLNVIDDKMYIWLDSRAESIMEEMNAKISPERRNAVTGMPGYNIFAAAKYYWVKKNEPETYAKTKYFSTVGSYVLHGFGSDTFAVEISDGTVSGLMDVKTLDWSKEMADKLGFDMAKFPPLCKPAEIVGTIKEDVAAKTGLAVGTKIIAGSGDQQLAAMGAGVIKDGAVSLTIGTFGLLAIGLANPNFDALTGMMIPSTPILGVFEVEGPQVSGATCYRWCRDTLCAEEVAEGEAKGVDPYVLMDDKYIDSAIVIGDQRKYVTALIIPAFEELKNYAASKNIGFDNMQELCSNPIIIELFSKRIEAIQHEFAGFEQIKQFTLMAEPFSIDSGELTNTLKVKRLFIAEKYREIIDKMYE